MFDDEEYQLTNRQRSKSASYGRFWCNKCDYYYYGGEIGKCPECGNKMNDKKIKYDRNRNSFNA
jgi:rubrerythrin